jgi:hypothetical protein
MWTSIGHVLAWAWQGFGKVSASLFSIALQKVSMLFRNDFEPSQKNK